MVPFTNWEVVSFSPKPYAPKFSWTVKKFSKLKKQCYVSDKFFMGGKNWVLKLYQEGHSRAYSKSLSIYVCLADDETMKIRERIKTRGVFRILNPFGHNHVNKEFNGLYEHKDPTNHEGWGCDQIMFLDKLREAYLDKDGSLRLDIEFEVVCTTTPSS